MSGLALVYSEPVTDDQTPCRVENRLADGFAMPFAIKVLPVTLEREIVRPLKETTREIFDLAEPPPGFHRCADCGKLENLIAAVA